MKKACIAGIASLALALALTIAHAQTGNSGVCDEVVIVQSLFEGAYGVGCTDDNSLIVLANRDGVWPVTGPSSIQRELGLRFLVDANGKYFRLYE